MRYLFPSLFMIFGLLLAEPAQGQNPEDLFCDSPEWILEAPQPLPVVIPANQPQTNLTFFRSNALDLQLDQRTSLAFNYQLFNLQDQRHASGNFILEPSFSFGLRCLFD